ncbi:MAG: hypothetical protein ACPGQS_12960 [Bradymonadia bacterium]
MRTTFFSNLRTLSILLCIIWFGACDSGQDQSPERLEPNDVSFLVPLKSVSGFTASASGQYGQILPRAYFDSLEPLTRVDEPDDLYANLDVVGVRLDPCFVEGRNTSTCGSQIRIILQPVFDPTNPTTRDGTIHLFFEVPQAEVLATARTLASIRTVADGNGKVGEHSDPQAAAEVVLSQIGAERLRRITFVAVHASDQAWTFGGFEVQSDGLEHTPMIGVDDHEQHLTSVGGTETLDATILPTPGIEQEAAVLMSETHRASLTDAEVQAGLEGLSRLLDPAAHDPGTVDCATCHMATAASLYFEASPGESNVPAVYQDTQNQRMFGYFGNTPSISPRVNAETDIVLTVLSDL